MAYAISNQMIGTVQTVLVEGQSKKNPLQMQGRTENNRVVNFIGHPRLAGQFVDVHIAEALPNSLRGRMVESSLENLITN
jgi:tRNA-2-methylthio-N6-dimethylallyladenosine synthase